MWFWASPSRVKNCLVSIRLKSKILSLLVIKTEEISLIIPSQIKSSQDIVDIDSTLVDFLFPLHIPKNFLSFLHWYWNPEWGWQWPWPVSLCTFWSQVEHSSHWIYKSGHRQTTQLELMRLAARNGERNSNKQQLAVYKKINLFFCRRRKAGIIFNKAKA